MSIIVIHAWLSLRIITIKHGMHSKDPIDDEKAEKILTRAERLADSLVYDFNELQPIERGIFLLICDFLSSFSHHLGQSSLLSMKKEDLNDFQFRRYRNTVKLLSTVQ